MDLDLGPPVLVEPAPRLGDTRLARWWLFVGALLALGIERSLELAQPLAT
jgi:hypothetical protein